MAAQDVNDRELWFALFSADYTIGYSDDESDVENAEAELAELEAEVNARYGDGASDRVSEVVVGRHMTHDEMLYWTEEDLDELLTIAHGER